MKNAHEGNAIVYCEGALGTTNGKTAHGLIRRTRRYRIVAVIDSLHDGRDAGVVLGSRPRNIPVCAGLEAALDATRRQAAPATHWVMGLAPDGGRCPSTVREHVKQALRLGLNVDSGLHDFLSDDPELAILAERHGVQIRDIRKTPPTDQLHAFTGKIGQVECLKVAILGTDSAVGKRTTAWMLVDALEPAGCKAQFIGTGQTAWLQGARYSIILDSLINDFVAGELEHAVWSAWQERRPDVIVIEGQGSLMNPAYPGGYEILAAGRPDVVVLQHAPARTEYDGFPGYPIHPLPHQIEAIELVSGRPVVAITLNHEHLDVAAQQRAKASIAKQTGLPVFDVLEDGADGLARVVRSCLERRIGPAAAAAAAMPSSGG